MPPQDANPTPSFGGFGISGQGIPSFINFHCQLLNPFKPKVKVIPIRQWNQYLGQLVKFDSLVKTPRPPGAILEFSGAEPRRDAPQANAEYSLLQQIDSDIWLFGKT